MALSVDAICHRYRKWPHEWLELTPQQQAIALACFRKAAEPIEQALKRVDIVAKVYNVEV